MSCQMPPVFNSWSINTATTGSPPEDQYKASSDENHELHGPITNDETPYNDSDSDPVMNSFQFLSQSQYQNICNTTRVFNLPAWAIQAQTTNMFT